MCVFQTALDLIEVGYEVHLVVDGVSSKRPSDRSTAIQVRVTRMDRNHSLLRSVVSHAWQNLPEQPLLSSLNKTYPKTGLKHHGDDSDCIGNLQTGH